jgi:two-component system, NtrC family, sensor kinase
LHTPDARDAAVLVSANRGIVYGAVCRWLLHEVRTPAQALSLAGELIARNDGALTEPIRQALASHARQLRPLLDLLSRAQQSPATTDIKPTALADTAELLTAANRGRSGPVTLDASGIAATSLPAVRANGAALTHAVLNLTMNAFDALADASAGAVVVTAGVVRDGTAVEIAVEDDGPGIAESMRDRLFEPFATTKSAPVAGLGLWVARHLVEAWGGTLAHDRTPRARGARFAITLDVWRRA